jgi:hypothetical protein
MPNVPSPIGSRDSTGYLGKILWLAVKGFLRFSIAMADNT